jgi:hypothetical protein
MLSADDVEDDRLELLPVEPGMDVASIGLPSLCEASERGLRRARFTQAAADAFPPCGSNLSPRIFTAGSGAGLAAACLC